MARGGKRTGTPGKAYNNRKDLNSPRTPALPKTAPSAQYGARVEQERALEAVPMGPPPGATAESPQSIPGGPIPGRSGAFTRPTERPEEPITAGLPSGPGVGPDALGRGPGFNAESQDLVQLAKYLPTLELLANQPNASVSTRNFVRRLRGAIPPEMMQ